MKAKQTLIQLIVIITVFILQNHMARCQNAPGYSIKGIIADSITKMPLSMLTVRLKNARNETVKVAITKDDGTFQFTPIAPATYSLFISAVGYGVKNIAIDSGALQSKTINLNTIWLGNMTMNLKEVTVMADRPIIRQKADRTIYDLKADPESKSNNLLTMMRKIPYLTLDGDDNLLMKGNSSFRVFINGKPSGSLESNLKAVLKSIPAATIERIEVITTPPARYDAEGLAGIINIITNKKINDGFNGSVNVNESFPIGGPGIGGSFTAKSGKFGVSAFGGGSISNSPETFNNNNRIDAGGITLQQQGSQQSNNKTAYLGTTFSYQADTLNLLTAQLNYNGSRLTDRFGQASMLSNPGAVLQRYDFESGSKATGYDLDAGINYELGFKAIKNRLLTFSYQYTTSLNNKKGNTLFDNRLAFNTANFLQANQQQFKEHTLQVDFVTPIKNVNIEAGLKAIFRNNSSDFDYRSLNAVTDLYETDAALSNAFTNTQNVFSAYNSYQVNLKSWNINAGIRVEQTAIRANFLSTTSLADQNYLNVIPSIAIGKGFKDGSNINFGFSQRIRRPGINRLNPYVDRSNPNYEVTGNPNLRPVLLNDIQFGYSSNKKLSVNLGANYSFMNNLDLQVVNFNPAKQITQITYSNTGKSSSAAINFSLSYAVTAVYTAGLNGNAMYLRLAGQAEGQPVTNNLLMYGVTLSNVVRLNHALALNADLGLNSSNPTGLQGYTNSYFYSAFNFNKNLVKNKLSIGGGIKNPFSQYRKSINTTFGPGFNQVYESRNYFRSFSISLNYNFGSLKDRINKNRVGIDNNDVAN